MRKGENVVTNLVRERSAALRAEAGNGHKGRPVADGAALRSDVSPRLQATLRALQVENALLRLVVGIHDRLDSLVLGGEGLESITAELAALLNRPVLLLDPLLCTMVQQPPPGASRAGPAGVGECLFDLRDASVERILRIIAAERRPLRVPLAPESGLPFACVLAPILGNDLPLGYLAILDVAGDGEAGNDEAALLLAGHAAGVCALALASAQQESAVSAQLRDELLDSLLLGEVAGADAARERAHRLGYDESRPYRAVFAALDEPETLPRHDAGEAVWAAARRKRLLASLARLAGERAPGAIVAERDEGLVLLLPESGPSGAGDLARALVHAASIEPGRPLTIGVGGVCQAPLDVSRSYRQARRAIEIGRRFGRRGEVVEFGALGLYRLLFQVNDPGELDAYVEQVLGPLLAYDRKHHTELVRTLATYLAHNSAVQATARALTIHVNTASYRLQRIEAISGLDLAQAEDRLQARVALKILDGCSVD
ncbi:MAG TPA: helix-turn-helix domain-containing protein [Dehalococcoidia bacterium]|nr:helix-turn-helix domain-containing protein [Dehalococcoidia bacterium]